MGIYVYMYACMHVCVCVIRLSRRYTCILFCACLFQDRVSLALDVLELTM